MVFDALFLIFLSQLAYYYQRKGWKTCLICADTFRAGNVLKFNFSSFFFCNFYCHIWDFINSLSLRSVWPAKTERHQSKNSILWKVGYYFFIFIFFDFLQLSLSCSPVWPGWPLTVLAHKVCTTVHGFFSFLFKTTEASSLIYAREYFLEIPYHLTACSRGLTPWVWLPEAWWKERTTFGRYS